MSRNFLLSMTAIFLILGLAITSPVQAAQWTFMVYLDADNNLESFGIDDFLEMATVGSNADINIVVQMDRIPGYDNRYGDWTTTKRFLVTPGMTPDPANAISDIGEANMGDPATLTAFINWATATYPATNYALILWDHGGGWRQRLDALTKALKLAKDGAEKTAIQNKLQRLIEYKQYKAVCWDDTNGGDCLYMKEVKNAMDAATTDVQLIGFDACLMAMTEVAYELRGTGPAVMVGSEKTEPGAGWPYSTILQGLRANPGWTPAQLGSWVVDKYYESYMDGETQSCLNLALLDNLGTVISTFATSMLNNWDTDQAAVKTAAQNVINALDAAIVHEHHGTAYPGANGLTIYFPTSTPDPQYNGTIIDFPGNTTWDEFLTAFVTNMGSSWIASARGATQTFDGEPFADLKDFCTRLVNYIPPAPCGSYTMSQPAYAFEDISTTGTNLNLTDDSYARFAIPFTFNFYGNNYTSVSVGSNGTVYFADAYMGYNNTNIPSTNDYGVVEFTAPFWDDLNPSAGGDVRWQVLGTAPNRRLIVQWTNVPVFGGTNGGTFQAILYEGSNNIRFNYLDVDFGDASYNYGASATIGLQRDATCGLKFSYNTASLTNNKSILFTPSTPCGGYTMSQPAYAFEDISTTGTNLYLTDDSYGRFAIPFTFDFYGNNYTSVSVGSNGTVYFADAYMGYNNTNIPSTNDYGVVEFTAPFWDDLDPSSGGDVRQQVLGTAPNRRLIVQWTNVPRYGGTNGGTFQAILYEGSNNIRFNYLDVDFGDAAYNYGASATIGLQRDTACGLKVSYNTASLTNNKSILFTRNVTPSSSAITGPLLLLLLD